MKNYNSNNKKTTTIPGNRVKIIQNRKNNSNVIKNNEKSTSFGKKVKIMGKAVNIAGHIVHFLKIFKGVSKK